jgi:Fe-S-cluster containining protein
MTELKYDCIRCGKCCQGEQWLRNLIRPTDIERWKSLGRDDILRYICDKCHRLVDPGTGLPWTQKLCPFLETKEGITGCRIYDLRPQTCIDFPIRKCLNPECSEKLHFHNWLWNGSCEASQKFRKDLVQALEPIIRLP